MLILEQAILYGKGQSNIIPKLRGTFEPPTSAAPTGSEQTALQKFKEQRQYELFPDEVDTPIDQLAKVRFARYRGPPRPTRQ